MLVNGTLRVLAMPDTDDEGPACTAWSGRRSRGGSSTGDWIRLLRAKGFEVVDLIEVKAPGGAYATDHLVDADAPRPSRSGERANDERHVDQTAQRLNSLTSLAGTLAFSLELLVPRLKVRDA